jgi:lipopolysaccharide/colanic/teichoic acid biosynthesis glycosyltransferase
LVDIAVALVGLAAATPVVAGALLVVRRDSPGPGLFVATRSGLDGRPFRMFKIRTMHVDAEQRLAALQHANLSGRLMIRIPDDPRVTRAGRWLRRTSLDELPQLWNVLRGDMSIVGPRPWSPSEVEALGPAAPTILSVRPGITGLWQVRAWESADPALRVALDVEYVQTWRFWRDLALIVQTPLSMVTRRLKRRPSGHRSTVPVV